MKNGVLIFRTVYVQRLIASYTENGEISTFAKSKFNIALQAFQISQKCKWYHTELLDNGTGTYRHLENLHTASVPLCHY